MTFEDFLKAETEITSLVNLEYIEKFTFKGNSSYKEYKVYINQENQVLILEEYNFKYPKEKTVYYLIDKVDLESKEIEHFKKSKEDQLERDWFFEFVNPLLEDEFIEYDDEMENKELSFMKGNETDFLNMVQDIIWADNTIKEYPFYISFTSGTDEEESKIEEIDELHQKTINLLEEALDQFDPSGFDWEYNDGAYDLKSGYYKCPHYLEYKIEEPTPHQKMDSTLKIKQQDTK